jgi:hypothetical protein
VKFCVSLRAFENRRLRRIFDPRKAGRKIRAGTNA